MNNIGLILSKVAEAAKTRTINADGDKMFSKVIIKDDKIFFEVNGIPECLLIFKEVNKNVLMVCYNYNSVNRCYKKAWVETYATAQTAIDLICGTAAPKISAEDAIRNLFCAVANQAAEDYCSAYEKHKNNPDDQGYQTRMDAELKFLKCEYLNTLTDGLAILYCKALKERPDEIRDFLNATKRSA